ncbi:hypothetical protein BN946_scf184912.g40 [Trametes cinnabarina]|uniref:Uncharacterized protein n=1 Tax=Pycnoporus cinnabarinus TaxID=5643 RepID=A0A060STR7_PYCCI|nr:hypothetical protein BN946_scf184912.g40 [Trametes cinnabarina]
MPTSKPPNRSAPQQPLPFPLSPRRTRARTVLLPASPNRPARRHEYLGPDPRVAGYWIDADGDFHIKWYDAFLNDHWIENRKWSFDVRLDARGDWVEVDDPE